MTNGRGEMEDKRMGTMREGRKTEEDGEVGGWKET